MSAGLDASQQAVLDALADILAPEAEGMPSASQVGIATRLLDQVLNFRPDLREPLMYVLRTARDREPKAYLLELERDDPATFLALGLIVAGGYYMSPDVRERIGYPGQDRQYFDADAVPPYESAGLLDHVRNRGPIWRDPDDTAVLAEARSRQT